MTLRKRLARLESRNTPCDWDDRPPLMIRIIGKTDDDVIGILTSNRAETIARHPGESLDDLIARARPVLATPWAGLPLIMAYAYPDDPN